MQIDCSVAYVECTYVECTTTEGLMSWCSGECRAQTGGEDLIGNGWTISLNGARHHFRSWAKQQWTKRAGRVWLRLRRTPTGAEPTVLDDNDERDVISAISSDALNNFDGGNRSVIGETATAGIWATYPQPFVSIITEVCDQVTIPMIPAHCNLNMPYNLNLLILRSYFNDS